MIVYTASYPRCGNSLVRDVIHTYLQYPTTSVYRRKPSYPVNFPYAGNWRWGRRVGVHRAKAWLLWDGVALFDQTVPPHRKNVRYLLRGCQPLLTPENRRRLAAEDTVFFIKTHALPFDSYFEGERVIQPIRHPGPVFRSYRNLWKKNHDTDHGLDFFIRGDGEFGSWSDYHRAWDTAAQTLNNRYLRLRFDDVLQDKATTAGQIAEFAGMPVTAQPDSSSFEARHESNPLMFGFGTNQGWEESYTSEQRDLLYSLHSDMMTRLGYSVPQAQG